MKRWGLLRIFFMKIFHRSKAESSPAEMLTDSSNDLGESLMKLPFELKQRIIYSLAPKERGHLRLINKAMLHIVDESMCDVQEIEIFCYSRESPSVILRTINPYNSAKNEHEHKAVPSSLPFLVKWIGSELKTLELDVFKYQSKNDNPNLEPLHRMFEALTSENICPKLKNLSLNMRQSIWDKNAIIFSEILKYITKRQLQAKATDHPVPFLHSLSLISEWYLFRSNKSAVDLYHSEKRRKVLRDLLDQCHGLKELDVDSMLVQKGLPIVALRYPTTLTELKEWRLGKTPRDLSTIIDNCPNLQSVRVNVGILRDDAKVPALASLSDLRKLTLVSFSMKEELVRIISQCLAAFKDHPFGASVARPWPQLKSVTVDSYIDEKVALLTYRLVLSGANCRITSVHFTSFVSCHSVLCAQSVKQLFNALSSEDAFSNLMELSINTPELAQCIVSSLVMRDVRQPKAFMRMPYVFVGGSVRIFSTHVYEILNDLLAYVTKRQSEVRLGKPFLRSLSIEKGDCSGCSSCHETYDPDELRDQLEQIHTTVQQILDQCHGLDDLYMESLVDRRINPNNKKYRELMELVPLRFPTTLKKLNGVRLENVTSD